MGEDGLIVRAERYKDGSDGWQINLYRNEEWITELGHAEDDDARDALVELARRTIGAVGRLIQLLYVL